VNDSGAEDNSGYLWDRHYGTCLQRYAHNSVVNCVAFNPQDCQTLVTVSDDQTLKIWRSQKRQREVLGVHACLESGDANCSVDSTSSHTSVEMAIAYTNKIVSVTE